MKKASEILSALHFFLKTDTDAELATALGVGRSTISTWRKRNVLDYEAIIAFCEKEGINLNWLFLGEGSDKLLTFQEMEKTNQELTLQVKTVVTNQATQIAMLQAHNKTLEEQVLYFKILGSFIYKIMPYIPDFEVPDDDKDIQKLMAAAEKLPTP